MRDDHDSDRDPDREPLSTENRWMALVFFLLVIGLFTAEVCVNFHPVKLGALFIIVAWLPLLVIHEAGHAVVAALVGWRVHCVVIGMGRTLFRFHVGRTPVEIRMVPVEGFVLGAPTNLRAPRLKSALFYFGGPAANLLVLLLLVLVLGPDTLLTRTENLGVLAAQSVAIAILISTFFNLVPHYSFTHEGRMLDQGIANDGMGIILSFRWSEADYARRLHGDFEELTPREEPEDDWED